MGTNKNHLLEILTTSTRLGLTSFGGPVAHLAYFKDEYIDRKKWLDEKLYSEIIALCQFLPGPASSQVGISIGLLRGGILGGILSFVGFTFPSVIALIVFALIYQSFNLENAVFIHSLKIVAVAVVLHALIGMGKKLTPDKPRIIIATLAAVIMLLFPNAWIQITVILIGGLLGFILFKDQATSKIVSFKVPFTKSFGFISLIVLVALLIILPVLNQVTNNAYVNIFDIFFRVGTLVFGGGHVVLPMIERELVPTGLIDSDAFIAGYGMAQAVPGPLFTFASYLGAIMNGVIGAIVATIAIFLPSFLMLFAALPYLSQLREYQSFQGVLMGVNATVVGILLAAFFNPVFISSIFSARDFAIALILFVLIFFIRLPAWMIVVIGVILGYLFNMLPL